MTVSPLAWQIIRLRQMSNELWLFALKAMDVQLRYDSFSMQFHHNMRNKYTVRSVLTFSPTLLTNFELEKFDGGERKTTTLQLTQMNSKRTAQN